jgi:hypothetical protein
LANQSHFRTRWVRALSRFFREILDLAPEEKSLYNTFDDCFVFNWQTRQLLKLASKILVFQASYIRFRTIKKIASGHSQAFSKSLDHVGRWLRNSLFKAANVDISEFRLLRQFDLSEIRRSSHFSQTVGKFSWASLSLAHSKIVMLFGNVVENSRLHGIDLNDTYSIYFEHQIYLPISIKLE